MTKSPAGRYAHGGERLQLAQAVDRRCDHHQPSARWWVQVCSLPSPRPPRPAGAGATHRARHRRDRRFQQRHRVGPVGRAVPDLRRDHIYGRNASAPGGVPSRLGVRRRKDRQLRRDGVDLRGLRAPPAWSKPVAITAVIALAAVNYRGVTRTAKLTGIIVTIVLLSLAVVVAGRPFRGSVQHQARGTGGQQARTAMLQSAGLLFFRRVRADRRWARRCATRSARSPRDPDRAVSRWPSTPWWRSPPCSRSGRTGCVDLGATRARRDAVRLGWAALCQCG